jgi:polyhydroxyalkanoate synthesis regulator phasin
MGKKLSAVQAAQLIHRNERIVRGWIKDGKLHAERTAGTRAWQIDIDDLTRVSGVQIPPDTEDKIPGIDAMVEEHEREIAELRRRIERLEHLLLPRTRKR